MVDIIPRKTRKPRRREDLPNPNLSASHSVNQLDAQFSARVDPETRRLFYAWARANRLSMRQATEYALKLAMSVELTLNT